MKQKMLSINESIFLFCYHPVMTRPEASASANSATSAYYLAGCPAEHIILYHTVIHLSSTFLK